MIPSATTSALRRAGRSTLSDRLRAVVPGVYAGETDDYGEPVEVQPEATVVFEERCRVIEDGLKIERLASGDERLAGANAVLRIDEAKGFLSALSEDALTLLVEHGPLRERVTRPARLEGLRHTRTGVYAFVRWTGPSQAALQVSVNANASGSAQLFEYSGIEAGSYSVTIEAQNAMGFGPASDPVAFELLPGGGAA